MKTDQPSYAVQFALGIGCLAAFFAARLPWLTHLLIWDEAMNLCTVRAFVAGGQDYFSGWFWRYPPTFNLMTSLLSPLEPGFADRATMLVLCIGAITLLILFFVNRDAFGFWPAIWSCYIWSVLPGSAFFGVWIKQDILVAPFGLVAILLCAKRRYVLSGLFLGFAFLAKEFALFYAGTIFVLWLVAPRDQRKLFTLLQTAIVTVLISAWWYVGFSSSVRSFFEFATEPLRDAWSHPWYYYLDTLHLHVGFVVILLMLIGLVAMKQGVQRRESVLPFWPIALIVPTWLILSVSEGKATWYTTTIYPAYATLAALGIMRCWTYLSKWHTPVLRIVAASTAAILLSTGLWGADYEERMKVYGDRIWWAAYASREAAETINQVADDDDRILITPMHYYDYDMLMPCPIFTWYLKDVAVMIRPRTLSFEDLLATVREYDLQWAMLSPRIDRANTELLKPLAEHSNVRPIILQGAFVIRTDPDLK